VRAQTGDVQCSLCRAVLLEQVELWEVERLTWFFFLGCGADDLCLAANAKEMHSATKCRRIALESRMAFENAPMKPRSTAQLLLRFTLQAASERLMRQHLLVP